MQRLPTFKRTFNHSPYHMSHFFSLNRTFIKSKKTSSNNKMCKSPSRNMIGKQTRKDLITTKGRARRPSLMGIMRRPSWGRLSYGHKSIRDPSLRQSMLPRNKACMNLPSVQCGDRPPAIPRSLFRTSPTLKNSSTHNYKWEKTNQQKTVKTKIKFLEELQNEPLKTTDQVISEDQKWKTLADMVDLSYKIRASYEYDWEKLMEEDLEEEFDVQNTTTKIASVHLESKFSNLPTVGPGVLLNA